MKPISITELVAARIEAKRLEDSAVQARRELDEQIATVLRGDRVEGTASAKLDEMGVRVTVTYGLTRKADIDALTAEWADLTSEQQAAFRWKADVSVTGLRKLQGAALAKVSRYIETKPATPTVKVELI